MKEIIVGGTLDLVLKENTLEFNSADEVKVRVKKTMLTYGDINAMQDNKIDKGLIPLASGSCVVSDPNGNDDRTLWQRIYVHPYLPCSKCVHCKTGNHSKCPSIIAMGRKSNGFLCDFKITKNINLTPLPDVVDDNSALFIHNVSNCLKIISTLQLKKGEYIVIIGDDITSNILCQLALYYQAMPILISSNPSNIELAKKHGVYYYASTEDDVAKYVLQITGGRMAENVAYLSSSSLKASKMVGDICSHLADICYFGQSEMRTFLSYQTAIEKQLKVNFIKQDMTNIPSAINIIATKAISLKDYQGDTIKFENVPELIKDIAKTDKNELMIKNTIIEI